jgi:hypothetical protein
VPRDRLASITVSVLSVAGGASTAWMREVARTIAEAVPDGTYRDLEGQTHAVEPDVLGPVLVEFFGR